MLDRRQLLGYAVYLVGGSSAAVMAGRLAAIPEGIPKHYFSEPRRAVLDTAADLMIPQTDTSGALAVGAPAYMDQMVASWASRETKEAFDGVLDGIDVQASAAYGKRFVMLDAELQFSVLQTYDATNLRNPEAPYGRFKELLMTVFFLSEPGATVVLRHEEVPGPWRGDIDVSEVGRAWAY